MQGGGRTWFPKDHHCKNLNLKRQSLHSFHNQDFRVNQNLNPPNQDLKMTQGMGELNPKPCHWTRASMAHRGAEIPVVCCENEFLALCPRATIATASATGPVPTATAPVKALWHMQQWPSLQSRWQSGGATSDLGCWRGKRNRNVMWQQVRQKWVSWWASALPWPRWDGCVCWNVENQVALVHLVQQGFQSSDAPRSCIPCFPPARHDLLNSK